MEKTKNSYRKSGVNIALANKFVSHIAKLQKIMSKKRVNTKKSIILAHLVQPMTLAI